ncbi:hypothetical protein MKL42_09475 [Acinetobacter sp. AOR15_HL]|uniref:hypothetical protein n=1 Tax=unclassified Acinetobacter TaxID=196816 RepID=UPI0022EA5B24|nr:MULTISPECIES: hypothetical protein [unclassified Acinetobacter]MDA3557720.1 hypothetical protein [Acinetobacter sp. AOR15_HL]MDA3570937.1 hypothetical protein [Acinetobacter sp. AOR14_HL]
MSINGNFIDIRNYGVVGDRITDWTQTIFSALSQLGSYTTLYIPNGVKWDNDNAANVYANMPDYTQIIDDSGFEGRYTSDIWQSSRTIWRKTNDNTGATNGNTENIRGQYHPAFVVESDAQDLTGGNKGSIVFRFKNGSKDDFQFGADRSTQDDSNLGISTYGGIVNGTRAFRLGGQTSISPHCFSFNSTLIADVSFVFGKKIRQKNDTEATHKLKPHIVRWSQPLDHTGDFEQSWVVRETVGTGTEIVQIHKQVISHATGDLTWSLKDGTTLALTALINQNKGLNLTKNIITPVTTYSLVAKDSGSYISNVNANGGYIVNLPKAVKGLYFEFSVDSLNNLRIQPNTADNFVSLNAGKYKQSNTIGSRLRVTAVTDNIWSVEQIGTWTDQV